MCVRDGCLCVDEGQAPRQAHTEASHPLAVLLRGRQVLRGGPHKHAILGSQPHRQLPKNLLQLVCLGARENDQHVVGVLHVEVGAGNRCSPEHVDSTSTSHRSAINAPHTPERALLTATDACLALKTQTPSVPCLAGGPPVGAHHMPVHMAAWRTPHAAHTPCIPLHEKGPRARGGARRRRRGE